MGQWQSPLESDAGDQVLGLKPGTVRLCEYTPLWPELYQAEAQVLRQALGAIAVDVQHVGSTAVPGMRAKPILDIAVAVRGLADVPRCATPLSTLGYQFAYWADLENDYLFEKGAARTHHVHVVQGTSRQWTDYITFRDALRGDQQLSAEYEQLKMELVKRFYGNRAAYTSAKAEFIRRVLSTAYRSAG